MTGILINGMFFAVLSAHNYNDTIMYATYSVCLYKNWYLYLSVTLLCVKDDELTYLKV